MNNHECVSESLKSVSSESSESQRFRDKLDQFSGCAFIQPDWKHPSVKVVLSAMKNARAKLVLAPGCFDILHSGHIWMLSRIQKAVRAALKRGDCYAAIIVALNTDDSVRRLKGPGRPVNSWFDRAVTLAGLRWVSGVVGLPEDDPVRLLETIPFDFMAKGDMGVPVSQIPGSDLVPVVLIPKWNASSTTDRIAKIRESGS